MDKVQKDIDRVNLASQQYYDQNIAPVVEPAQQMMDALYSRLQEVTKPAQDMIDKGREKVNVVYNQYNQSPEALNPFDIYKNTEKMLTFNFGKGLNK